jgi:uncharacterized membrane protein
MASPAATPPTDPPAKEAGAPSARTVPSESEPHAPEWLARAIDGLEHSERAESLARALGRLTPAVSGAQGAFLRGEWLGHALHPLMTDLPLGCWIGANVLDLVGGRRSRVAARRLVGAGLLAVPLTALSGLADWADSDDVRVGRVGAVHAVGNGAAALAYLGSWLARRAGRHRSGVALGLVGGGLAVGTGYLGGHLSFARRSGTGLRGLRELSADPQTPQAA